MLYLERTPEAPLSHFVRALWYAQASNLDHRRERVLPTGRVQLILNLNRDYLLDCPEGERDRKMAPALITGARSAYEIIDSSDLIDLIGVVFEPGGFSAFAADAVDLFSNRSIPLESVWGSDANALRERLREMSTPQARLRLLEGFLGARLRTSHGKNPMVEFALRRLGRNPGVATVREVAHETGWSERRFSQVFREEVGLTPKVWCRVQRFQQAVQRLHAGGDVRWAELALDCGFYDQSHFANEFRAFSGVDASTYSARRSRWANHIRVD